MWKDAYQMSGTDFAHMVATLGNSTLVKLRLYFLIPAVS